jgi:hypothetical protein
MAMLSNPAVQQMTWAMMSDPEARASIQQMMMSEDINNPAAMQQHMIQVHYVLEE